MRARAVDPGHGPGALLERASTWGGPVVLAGLFVFLARWTWGTWPDVLIDFGRELYVPWRLSQGAILFRDVAWFNGPLSAHFNATVFQALGPSLASLVWVNLALLALLTAMLWDLLRSISDAFAATLACAVLLTVFGFGQLVGIGNYNYICPYSHEVTHGVFLAVAALYAASKGQRRAGWCWPLLSGLALGLSFLTKPEVFLAAAAGVGITVWLQQRAAAGDRVLQRRMRYAFAFGTLLPVVFALLVLASELPFGQALMGTLGGWPSVLSGGAGELAFYEQGMGLDAPLERLGELLAWSGRWALVFAPAFALAWSMRRGSALVTPMVVALMGATAGLLMVSGVPWLQAGRPLPLFALVIVAILARRALVDVRARELERTPAVELGFALFALVLLAKMALNARVFHYGFALAMPATLICVTALAGWLPTWLDRRERAGHVLRAVAVAAFAVFAYQHLSVTRNKIAKKTVVVGTGDNRFQADVRGAILNRALGDFQSSAEPGATLAVLPEGVMVNWLLKSHNPTPYINFMPPEFLLFGEQPMLRAFEAAPPEYVMLIHKDTSEYGLPFFGPDYGTQLASWVQERYEPLRLYGDPPLIPGSRFGIRLLRRR